MDAQNLLNKPIAPASLSRRRGEPASPELQPCESDEQNKIALKNILADGESDRADDFISVGKLTRRQNIILSSVGVVVVLAIGLAMWQMGRVLKLPLPTTGKEKPIVQQEKDPLDLSSKSPSELKSADTDADKINDFEELYIYETSPYLADSDSDGIDDYDEIANHTDPTCPEGKSCFQVGAVAGGTPAESDLSAVGESKNISLTQVSAADLRKLLIQSGKVTAEQAAAIDDKTLLDIYGQALEQNPDLAKQLSSADQPAAGVSIDAIAKQAKSSDEAVTALGGVSAATVRQMLLDQGFSQAELKKIDDKTLMSLYQEALDKASVKESGN